MANGGSIVFISSIAGMEAAGAPLPYSAAKAALLNYSKNLARAVADRKIRVNSIAPGNILFPGGSWEKHLAKNPAGVEAFIAKEVPQQRFGTPEEIAALAAFLCSGISAFATGACYVMDGGQTRTICPCKLEDLHERHENNRAHDLFDLTGRVAIVTGGAGLLGYHHGDILAAAGAHVVLLDLAMANPALRAQQLTDAHGVECLGLGGDITSEASLVQVRDAILAKFGRIDILINNAANNPKVEDGNMTWSRLENFPHRGLGRGHQGRPDRRFPLQPRLRRGDGEAQEPA